MRRSAAASPRASASKCACAGRTCACWSAAAPAAAIAGAFGAPLTGAFYAFELIIGAYSLAIAAPGVRRRRWPAP